MASKELIEKVNSYFDYIKQNGISEEICEVLVKACNAAYNTEDDREYALVLSAKTKCVIEALIRKLTNGTFFDLEKWANEGKSKVKLVDFYYDVLLYEAQNGLFDSYLLYLEKNRVPKERFYQPKRKQFLKIGVIQAFQDLLDDKLDILSISLPPGTGKTTLNKFFMSYMIGLYPKEYNLFFSHSADICRMYYDGVLQMLTDSIEYTWHDIFYDLKVTSTNAKSMKINVGKFKAFDSLQCGSRGSDLAGKVRASKLLAVDDLIGNQSEALNRNILDKIWSNDYTTDARQRKTVDENQRPCKELHIATRWSVADVIGRLQVAYEGNDRARFIAVPDIDPETGESNFDFEYNGFSVEFFKDQEKLMDEITYKCLYKNEPIEREGLLYHSDDLRRYVSIPDKEPDAILGVCDTKTTGKDFMVLPVFYQYDSDYYLVDCICDDSADFGKQESRLANIIVKHNMQQCEFESNAGGSRLARNVDIKVRELGGRCNITTKPTETNKETRIIVNSDWIKRNCLFKEKEDYNVKSDYGIFMNFMLSYSVKGKNAHDDVPDALANFALYITNKDKILHKTIITGSLW